MTRKNCILNVFCLCMLLFGPTCHAVEMSEQTNKHEQLVQNEFCAARSASIFGGKPEGEVYIVSPLENGEVLINGKRTTLRGALLTADNGDTFLLEDGEYIFEKAKKDRYTGLHIKLKDITLRSASGDPNKVVLNGAYADLGGGSALITVDAPGFKIADITLTKSLTHLLHAHQSGDAFKVHNVRFVDASQQFLKASASAAYQTIREAEITCSEFLMTEQGRENVWGYGDPKGWTRCYTGGIDAHRASNWRIADSKFEGIYCDTNKPHPAHKKSEGQYIGGLAEHAIHLWHSDEDSEHLIERNIINNCARGIGVGMGNNFQLGRAVIQNNMIKSEFAGSAEHDVAIIVEALLHATIRNNQIEYTHPNAYPFGIEYRFEGTEVLLEGNVLTNGVRARDGARQKSVDS